MKLKTARVVAIVLLLYSFQQSRAQEVNVGQSIDTPTELIADLYDLLTFEAEQEPDWDLVRSLFLDQAVIVLRTSRVETTIFTADGFIEDFINFIRNSPAGANGFTDKIIRMAPAVMGDMANVFVLYEAQITGSPRPPQQGVDSFQLIRKDDRWWIVSLTNELPSTGAPIPDALR